MPDRIKRTRVTRSRFATLGLAALGFAASALVLAPAKCDAQSRSDPPTNTPPKPQVFYGLRIPTENAVAVGIFRDYSGCVDDCSWVYSLGTLQIENLSENAKIENLCWDGVCTATRRDIVTLAFGGDIGTSIGVSGGYAGVADAEVSWQISPALGAGFEIGVQGPLKVKRQGARSAFQDGGNILVESGIGDLMFHEHVILGMRRFRGVSGYVTFMGEKAAGEKLYIGALSRQGSMICLDEAGVDDGTCPPYVEDLLRSYCDQYSGCRDGAPASPDSPGASAFFDQEELDEALESAQEAIGLVKETVGGRLLETRLADAQTLLQQIRNDSQLADAIRTEFRDGLAGSIEEVLSIVTTETRFGDFASDFANLRNMDLRLSTVNNGLNSRLYKLKENQKSLCRTQFLICSLFFPNF